MTSILTMTDVHRGTVKIDKAAGGVLFCDVDGTVADLTHRRKAADAVDKKYRWPVFCKNMDKDLPIQWVIDAVNELYAAGWTVVMMTARSAEHKFITEKWLQENGVKYHTIYTRADFLLDEDGEVLLSRKGKPLRDCRKDSEVKAELLAKARGDGYEPTLVFDDRNQVVDMWRGAGIMCVQTAEGDF